ncbi:MAG: NADH-quinone oxidoreductase subunit L [Gemmatimonadaceae bacterium]|jgi:NADH-quinone oxidoreductase subunit L|nr:NADH-quinone oxidoreductase subunit L [Gemmatimonadaceae bacterium]
MIADSTTTVQQNALLAALIGLPALGAVANGALAVQTARTRTHAPDAPAPVGLASMLGVGSIAAAFIVAVLLFVQLTSGAGAVTAHFGDWLVFPTEAGRTPLIAWDFTFDRLSSVLALVITGVGTLIHVFSVGYMNDDPGFARYFAYLNLFVAFMLVLVLGASYPVLFIGWEGVGLCSYLLIGFWFGESANADAGRKAFVVNRIGDMGLIAAMCILFTQTGHLDFAGAHAGLSGMSTGLITAIGLALLLGCAGKSAQVPLYLWLPDAMAGPTPVSALIHAATMVTAGVYLVVRASPIFAASPTASLAVALIGAITALFAASIALRQWDIKKVLAYSTVSQLGYMFMGVGVGAYTAGVFHLVTHAFFKALLFLGAGAVIHAMHAAYHHAHEHGDAQDLRNMGGLRAAMPATGALMWIATLAIVGIPPLAGFFSKDEILVSVFARAMGSPLASASLMGLSGQVVLFVVLGFGTITALLTAIYMTRLALLAFEGPGRSSTSVQQGVHDAHGTLLWPLVALGILTVAGGWLNLPALIPIGPVGVLEHWLEPIVGETTRRLAPIAALPHEQELWITGGAVINAIFGIGIALWLWRRWAPVDAHHATPGTGFGGLLERAYDVDAAVQRGLVGPVLAFAKRVLWGTVDRGVDGALTGGGGGLARAAQWVSAQVQVGDASRYVWVVALGVLGTLAALAWRS